MLKWIELHDQELKTSCASELCRYPIGHIAAGTARICTRTGSTGMCRHMNVETNHSTDFHVALGRSRRDDLQGLPFA